MVAPASFGGTFDTQVLVGIVVILTTTFLVLALSNIKRLQIEQPQGFHVSDMVLRE